ncbi:helix-turn-helix domain-containing protein [Rhizobium oryzicola]|uniref:Helix-turn-helix domain-containing protein n=1 Tax=Rhizobium oryzicola TaxID=1232668 RepID=A0ABT8SXF9_9HYPH|nr:helix-turn-helix domain-containing protein [Rhizobium oryzicola]MDO1582980.1 helix-turn-helix domain-containing protein [Rhizobium oryzicola]
MAGPVPTYNLYGEESAVERAFWVHCETIAARSSGYRWEIGLHRHESFLQFLHIRSGSGDALLPSGTVPLIPPCVVVVPPGPEHGFRFSPDIDGLVVTLVPERLRLARDLPGKAPWFPLPTLMELGSSGDAAYLDATFQRIAEEYDGQRVGRDECLEAHVATVILLLGRLLLPEPQDDPADLNRQRVQQLMRLIADHYREQLTVESCAARLKLSPTHLNRIVRQVTGASTHDLIIGKSIEEAKRALVFTASSVQAIAESLGFSDAAYFSRCFRHRTGMTPKAYRDAERAKLRNKEAEGSV